MKTIKDITGLEKPDLKEYLEEQVRKPEDDCYSAYMDNLEAYTSNLEQFILNEEAKKQGYIKLLYGDLKDLGHLNERAIDLNCDLYIMLEEALGVNFYKDNKKIWDTLHEQWYDNLHRQERIIMGLQNFINMEKTGRGEKKDENDNL